MKRLICLFWARPARCLCSEKSAHKHALAGGFLSNDCSAGARGGSLGQAMLLYLVSLMGLRAWLALSDSRSPWPLPASDARGRLAPSSFRGEGVPLWVWIPREPRSPKGLGRTVPRRSSKHLVHCRGFFPGPKALKPPHP